MDTLPIVTPRQAGIYVRRSREHQGLTRAQLAEAAGVSERLLASLELGDATGIRLDKLLAVFSALGIGLAAQGESIGQAQADSDTQAASTPHPKTAANSLTHTTPGKRKTSDAKLKQRKHDRPSISYQDLLAEIAHDQGIELVTEERPLHRDCEVDHSDNFTQNNRGWNGRGNNFAERSGAHELSLRRELSRYTPLALHARLESHLLAKCPFAVSCLDCPPIARRNGAQSLSNSKVRPNNPIELLAHIGRDCPGRVFSFWRQADLEKRTNRTGRYSPLSEHEIAQRLSSIRQDETTSWMGSEESWSLGGNQGKFALGLHDESWCECIGAAATTHIFKNGVVGFKLQALNEYVCMKTAARSGINAAGVEYRFFEDEPALIVSRYDRVLDASGQIARLHQEDFCQALGVMPNRKYTTEGGPTTHDVLRLLCSTRNAHLNLLLFTQMLFYNCLIGAPDAHAKNYSLILGNGRNAVLAPMYDVASGACL